MDGKTIQYTEVQHFGISVKRGFLPEEDPPLSFPEESVVSRTWDWAYIATISRCAQELPRWLAAGCVRRQITEQMEFAGSSREGWTKSFVQKMSHRELAWLMRAFSFLGSAWVWGGNGEGHTDRIPAFLSMPWCAVAEKLLRPPILSYDSYGPQNWFRFDPKGPIALGNLGVIQNFYGGLDENWFIPTHVEIEADGAGIPVRALELVKATVSDNPTYAIHCFDGVIRALARMNETMKRMPEGCDPYIYFKRVRPYIHGWKDNPALPNGIVYEGCFGNEPQKFRGETGAQSALFPTLYALLGVAFKDDDYLKYLREMRDYMTEGHRRFIGFLEEAEHSGFSVVALARKYRTERPRLLEQIRETLSLMVEFLETHIGYASAYIEKQAQKSAANPTAVGTGGTPFMKYLQEHISRLKEMQSAL